MNEHWAEYGRNYYMRYDYEGVDIEKGMQVYDGMVEKYITNGEAVTGLPGGLEVEKFDNFAYTDPVDGSEASGQGIRMQFVGGSRVVFRKSGTGTVGMTLRVYMERYCEAKDIGMSRDEALKIIVDAALTVSQITELTGFTAPSVIT